MDQSCCLAAPPRFEDSLLAFSEPNTIFWVQSEARIVSAKTFHRVGAIFFLHLGSLRMTRELIRTRQIAERLKLAS